MNTDTRLVFQNDKEKRIARQLKCNCFGYRRVVKWITFIFCLLCFQNAKTQTSIVWADSCVTSSFYGKIISSKITLFHKVHEHPGGDLVAVGYVGDTGAIVPGFKGHTLVMRVTRTGNMVWSRFIGRTDAGVINDASNIVSVVTTNGDIVLAVDINEGLTTGHYAIRLDGNGNIVWRKRLPYIGRSFSTDIFKNIIQTSDGGFLLVGTATVEAVALKLDGNGNVLWGSIIVNIFGYYVGAQTVAESPSAYYLSGISIVFTPNFTRNYTARLDKTTGSLLWVRAFDFVGSNDSLGPPLYTFNTMTYNNDSLTLSGGTYLNDFAANNYEQVVVNINEEGFPLSGKRISNLADHLSSFFPQNGTMYHPNSRTGVQYDYFDASDYYVFKLKEDYTKKWAWKIPLSGKQMALDSKVLSDSSIIIAGHSRNASQPGAELLKTAASGKLEACVNQDRSLSVNALVFKQAGEPDLHHDQNNTYTSTDAPVEVSNGTGFNWQVECSSYVICRMSKINGNSTVCANNSGVFSVTRSGNCNGRVTFSSNAPSVIVNNSDSSAAIVFTTEGTYTLYARMPAACKTLTDSMVVHIGGSGLAFSLGPDTTICTGNTIILKAPGNFSSYLWQDGSTDSIYRATQPGQYHITAVNACGNIFRDTIQVNALPPMPFSIGPDRVKCNSDTLHIEAPPGFSQYRWSPNYNISSVNIRNVVVNPLRDTTYFVVAEKRPGCLVFDTVKIKVNTSPVINLGRDTTICVNDTIVLNAGIGFDNYLWNNNTNTQFNIVTQAGVYSVTGYYSNGCPSYDTIVINNTNCIDDLYIPSAFTPNGDGLNDVFKPAASRSLKKYRFQIYNRWGQKIFETNDISKGWNGSYNGKNLERGAFIWHCIYQFEGEGEKMKKGTVTLIR
jgi:gliding motility-associated-like protein